MPDWYICNDCSHVTIGVNKCGSCFSDNVELVTPIHKDKKCACGCGQNVNFNYKKKRYSDYISSHNPRTHKDGSKIITEKGYVKIRIGEKYFYEHRLVMEVLIGRSLIKEENVHHINGNRADNNPSNLQLFPNAAEHTKVCYKIHNRKRIKN